MAKRKRESSTSDDEEEFSAKTSRKNNAIKKRKGKGNSNDATVVSPTPVVPHETSKHTIQDIGPARKSLLKWFESTRDLRAMPWRKPFNPSANQAERAQRAYDVWVSEIMLQQTQVATVIPYYQKWMEAFPTLKDLAASDVATVHSLWKGLGYYSRATRLLSGAQKAMKDYDGQLPDNAQDMEKHIPGIGRYSAGAISSIAYGEAAPVLDGNVHRLLSRVLALHAPPKSKATLDVLWNAATAMVQEDKDADQNPGDINQALIELGSTVCKVKEPLCDECPMNTWCSAYNDVNKSDEPPIQDIEDACTLCEAFPDANVSPTAYPMKVQRKKTREELDLISVVEWRSPSHERWFLLVKRPATGLLAGLHEFPTTPNVSSNAEHNTTATNGLLKSLLRSPVSALESTSNEEVKISQVTPAADIVHLFSHIKKTFRVQWLLLEGGQDAQPPALCDLSTSEITTGKKQKKMAIKKPRAKRNARSDESTAEEEEKPVILQSPGVAVKWVKLDQIDSANIGTGVVKVWNLVKQLWD